MLKPDFHHSRSQLIIFLPLIVTDWFLAGYPFPEQQTFELAFWVGFPHAWPSGEARVHGEFFTLTLFWISAIPKAAGVREATQHFFVSENGPLPMLHVPDTAQPRVLPPFPAAPGPFRSSHPVVSPFNQQPPKATPFPPRGGTRKKKLLRGKPRMKFCPGFPRKSNSL